jgi:hypothetical protein
LTVTYDPEQETGHDETAAKAAAVTEVIEGDAVAAALIIILVALVMHVARHWDDRR